MTKDEALREAIDTLKSTKHGNCDFAWIDETLKKCTEALAQPPLPVQEPVKLRRGNILRCIETDELCTVWATSTTSKTLIKWSANNFGNYTAEQIGELFWIEPEPPPQQQAEPVMINGLTEAETNASRSVVGLTKQAEPVAWDKPSASFDEWWDSDRRRDTANPFTTDSFAFWAFEGWQAALAQRPWVGLTEQERNDLEDALGLVIGKLSFDNIEAKLKELNK